MAHAPQSGVVAEIARRQGHRLAIALQRLLLGSHLPVADAHAGQRVGVVGGDLVGDLPLCHRGADIILLEQEARQGIVDCDVVRLEAGGDAHFLDRRAGIAGFIVRVGQVAMGREVGGIERQRLAILVDRIAIVAADMNATPKSL